MPNNAPDFLALLGSMERDHERGLELLTRSSEILEACAINLCVTLVTARVALAGKCHPLKARHGWPGLPRGGGIA